MVITSIMKNSGPFKYAYGVQDGSVVTGKKIKQAVHRFFQWIETADDDGYYLDHKAGMHVINFFPLFLNHTKGSLVGEPFHLELFQQFTMYNVFAWKNVGTKKRRINTVYDKRAKKNGKTAEMAGLALYCMSFDFEMEAEIYVGATKEDQARLCWKQAKQFITSAVANPMLKKMGFWCKQRVIGFNETDSTMMALGGDSKTQDGINSHVSIIDEYHAHRDDTVKENLESSSVQRAQPILWHITTAGVNVQSVCKQYEDSVTLVLNGQNIDNHLFVMIHDLDPGDDWNDKKTWCKANPLLFSGALKIEAIEKEYTKAINQPSKIPNFKTKHLNMWVDALQIWIPAEIYKRNEVEKIPKKAFKKHTGFGALDLSSTTDFTAFIRLSEPDKNGFRYMVPKLFCPADTIKKRSTEDKVPYEYWRDAGFIISTPGEVCDYSIIESHVIADYREHNLQRIEVDAWNSTSTITNLMEAGVEVSKFSQGISHMTHPTKQFEKMIYEGIIKYEYNPVMEWMLSGCVKVEDANENVKIHKGHSNRHGKRVDGIIAAIMALGGSLSLKEQPSKYENDQNEIYI